MTMLHTSRSRPRLRVNVNEPKVPPSSYAPSTAVKPEVQAEKSRHLNTSIFRSSQIQIHIHSPSVKVAERREYGTSRSLPVFGDHDKVEGVVHLDPKLCSTPGRLTVSMEGAFVYISSFSEANEDTLAAHPSGKNRHLFFSSSMVFPCGESNSPLSASSLREAFTATMLGRRPSLQDISSSAPGRPFRFSFDIPRPTRPGEELPPTFSTLALGEVGVRGRTTVERAEVDYRVVALWESLDPNERARLDATVLLQSDTDFQSLDGLSLEPESWLEIPLRSDRPIPFKCAITLPVPSTFPRSASVPYYVVFTTKPRSTLLAREIAVDATITVSLLRQVTVLTSRPTPPHSSTSSLSSSSSSDDSDASSTTRRKFLRRVAKSASPLFGGSSSPVESHKRKGTGQIKDKPLPELPPPGVQETRTLQTNVSIGFPKRPRHRVDPSQQHPSLGAHSSLPDGLYKGKMRLNKNMLPAIDWAGLSVKYFLEVSVLFGQDELRARIPIRIL